jgi:hypothetical protein
MNGQSFFVLIYHRDLFNDKYTGKTTGGFVVYYVSGGKGQVTAFKPVSKIDSYAALVSNKAHRGSACSWVMPPTANPRI